MMPELLLAKHAVLKTDIGYRVFIAF